MQFLDRDHRFLQRISLCRSFDVRSGQPQQNRTQKDMLLKMSGDGKRQEKEREKQLKDDRTVRVAPAKGSAPSTGKSEPGNSLNRTAIDPGR